MNQARQILKTEQVISQIRKNQKIRYRGKKISVEEYIQNRKGVAKKIKIRGLETDVVMNGLRVYLVFGRKIFNNHNINMLSYRRSFEDFLFF